MNSINPLEQTTPPEAPVYIAAPQPAPKPTHIGSVIQLIASILVLLISWLLSGIMAFSGLTQAMLQGGNEIGQATASTLMAASFFVIGGVALGNALYSAYRLMSNPPQETQPAVFKLLLHPIVLIILLGLSLLFGFAVSQAPALSWWALPPAHIVASVSGILLFLWLAVRELNPGSPQRVWGSFISGLVIAPIFAVVVELIVIVLMLILVSLYLATNPDYANLLESLQQLYLTNVQTPSPEQMLEIVEPLLGDRFIIFIIFLMVGVFVPLIEELIKPIGVWLSAGKDLTPGQGFALGAISGGGYALFENLTINAPNAGWAMVAATRNGTTAIHILASGLVGWALVHAWREKRYLRLAGTYLCSVLLHGTWNSLAILNALNSTVTPESLNEFDNLWIAPHWVNTGIIGLFMLTLVAFGALIWLNRKLRPRFIETESELETSENELTEE